ncbi:beta-ketoacyl synthase N-terminal-like domain-containing protein [Paenibacillus sp. S-38]|uniref:beta-ketoacyl synthase N-terminal-like domain-containing protein n=1 Tax=Paenibacillus sp. S-38 TaxID=3416710 RepID=UPI003CEBE82A
MNNDERFQIYTRHLEAVNRLLARLLWGHLHTMGLLTGHPADQGTPQPKGIKDMYCRWLDESLAVLRRHQLLGLQPPALHELWNEWDRSKTAWLENMNLRAQIVLVEATLRALPDILTGRVPATDVMFPKGTMKLVEGIYKHNLVADYFNEVLSGAVLDLVQNRLRQDPGKRMRILEIGAGTGGTSSMVLSKLQPYADGIQEYCYTDISKAFLKHGELHYGDQHPYLTFRVLNIEEPVSGQGIDTGGYDLVIAANVLHATKNIRQTLRNAKSIVKNNGSILLNELTDSTLFTHLTFGLLEGWWKYEDASLRIPGCPGLYPLQWKKVLEMEGYKDVFFPAKDMEAYGQQIIAARSDGMVQLKQAMHPNRAAAGSMQTFRQRPEALESVPPSRTGGGGTDASAVSYVKRTIVEKLSETLKVKPGLIDPGESFADYGVDSITGVQLVLSINQTLGIELESTDLFDYSSVHQLAVYIMDRHKGAAAAQLLQRTEAGQPAPGLPGLGQEASGPASNRTLYGRRGGAPAAPESPGRVGQQDQAPVPGTPGPDQVKATLLQKVSECLKVPLRMIDPDDSFSDYGVDSITGVQLVQSINKALQIELESTDLFDYSTVNQLADHIQSFYTPVRIRPAAESSDRADLGAAPPVLAGREQSRAAYSDLPRRGIGSPVNPPERITRGGTEGKEIAVIGISGRFAGSDDVHALWEHLANGRDLTQEVTRWDLSALYSPGTPYCNRGGFIEGIDRFDPMFFNITGLEAAYMDPQQRIFLEESWKALEDAGYAGAGMQGKSCGVYVGCGPSDYAKLLGDQPPAQAFWGNASSIIPARIAYYLDLQGPAIAVDTACSSSLAAIHLACQGLWAGETEMALAGGIFVQTTPDFYLYSNRAGMLSPSGRCYAFDHRADGFVPGEGAGVVVLKRLRDAQADGDHIYGVIRGTAMNQDGSTNGITAPSALSQERLERAVYDTFGLHPEEIQVVEAHGTGTQLGDPIEYKALTRAFGKYTEKTNYCALGTVKSSIGHTQYASGVAGLIKVLLSLKHKQIVPSLHYEKTNANIRTEGSPFYVNRQLLPWPAAPRTKRRAAISSFGFSGTNVHMVIEEAPDIQRFHESRPAYLIALSARTEEQLRRQVTQLAGFCAQEPDLDCGNMSHTLLTGRKHLAYRWACTVRSLPELMAVSTKWLEQGSSPRVFTTLVPQGPVPQEERERLEQYGNECIRRCAGEFQAQTYMDDLAEAAELFVQGCELEFHALFNQGEYSRIPLPTYPFGKERYWVPENGLSSEQREPSASVRPSRASLASEQRRFSWMTKHWEPAPVWAEPRGLNGSVAVLTTEETRPLAELIARFLPEARAVYVDGLQAELQQPDHVWGRYIGCIDLIGCGREGTSEVHWIAWLQKLIEYGQREHFMMLCVTRSLESYRNETVNMAGALRVGLYRMLQSEYSYVRSRHMDGELAAADAILAEQIAQEFLAANDDTEVCYRSGTRYRALLQEAEEYGMPAGTRRSFPERHVLWITGGTKGLGLLCARHFVKHYGVKQLVLSGREMLPPRDQWDAYEGQNTAAAQKIRSIRDIENEGVEVFVLSVDLGDVQAMRASVDSVKRFMGPIGGVIHCAGLADLENLAFIRKSPEVIGQVLNPKVMGLDVMYHSFQNEPLQFFVLYSSVSAIIPTLGAGISDYAMANAYMDYFAESKAASCPIVSIQWSSWREVGIGEVTSLPYKQTGMLSMSNEEGLSMLDRILALKRHTVVLPALVNSAVWEPGQLLARRRIQSEDQQEAVLQTDSSPAGAAADGNDGGGLVQAAQAWLVSLFSKELRMDASEFGPDIAFQQYGMDSILLAQVITRMDYELEEVALDPSIILEYPTMRTLAGYLAAAYPDVLRKRLAPQGQQNSSPSRRLPEETGASAASAGYAGDLLQDTEAWLIALFAKELRVDASEFRPDIPFQQYGMDSILLAQVITRMDYELDEVALDPSLILEYPTMRGLAAHLSRTYPDVLRARLSKEAAPPAGPARLQVSQEPYISPVPGVNSPADSPKRRTDDQEFRGKIAVVGVDCQFPDASDKTEYWENLKGAKDSIRPAPANRWDREKEHPVARRIHKVGAFLDQIEEFDPSYFQIPESLAVQLDPLQRKILECGAGALADAGYGKEELWNRQVGVFIGARTSTYYQKLGRADKDTIVGVGQNFIAAHLSHVYNFKGPNMIVDTACSSSLTAIHMAAKSILNGESEMALAGGVDIILDESIYVLLSTANILSPDGRCQSFSANANGIGVGEGCGVVVLKPLHQAIQDNDKIYGVIDGSAINNDGNTMGITTPNPEAQKELIEKAIADAKIHPGSVSYVETHGTGTLIGDPIELKALTSVFSKYTEKRQYCGVGSVKSNIGHLISAAGVASFIKVLLSLVHEELPPTLHCSIPNPRFQFDDSPFYIVQEHTKWTSDGPVLRAGISSFGLGGNNAHIIVSNEGIPVTHRASLASRKPVISFNRKRYWPESKAVPPTSGEFAAFFETVEVE